MPELPEVETIRLGLQKKLVGLKIKNIQILNPKSFQGDPKKIIGKKIIDIWRRAKMLGVILSGDDKNHILLIHLKMSGQLIFIPNDNRKTENDKRFVGGHPTKDMNLTMPNNSTRVIFELENYTLNPLRYTLFFNDQRKFGWIKLGNLTSDFGYLISGLGPEPLEKEFTWQILKNNLHKHKNTPIKVAILDQTIVSGIGNIYACEALFLAKIHPSKKVSTLTDKQIKSLHAAIKKSLKLSLKHGGSSQTHFVNEAGERGYFLNFAFVYGRENLPCKVCQTKIQKFKLAGRGTYLCPSCQVAPD